MPKKLAITQKNVDEMAQSSKPELKRIFGVDGNLGEQLGLTKDWVTRIIKAVGNYGESFDRNVGAGSQLWHRARFEQTVEPGRNSIRAADPLTGHGFRRAQTTAATGRKAATCARRAGGLERRSHPNRICDRARWNRL